MVPNYRLSTREAKLGLDVSSLRCDASSSNYVETEESSVRFCVGTILLVGWMICTFLPSRLSGQTIEDPVPRDQVIDAGTLPFKAKLYFEDENGNLVLYPMIPLEELTRLQQMKSTEGDFQFSQVQISANVAGEVAVVEGQFQVRLGKNAGFADVPLKFGTCQLGLAPPLVDRQGDEELRSRLVATKNGYRWQLIAGSGIGAEAKPSYGITLTGKSKISQVGARRSLRLSLPQKSCQVTILLPADAIDVRLSDEDVVDKSQQLDDGLEVTVLSRGGDFNISWKSNKAASRFASVEAESNTTFEIGDPQTAWSATTTLTLRWYGDNPTETFQLSLPPGARWLSPPQYEFDRLQVTRIDGPEGGEIGRPEVYNLQNIDSEQFKTELELEWELLPVFSPTRASGQQAKIALPVINGVDAHRGRIDCNCPAEYLVRYDASGSEQFIQQTQITDPFAWQQLQFRFSQEELGLSLTFRKEDALPTVRPLYHVVVEGNKLVMTAWLDCSFSSNQRAPSLGMDFGPWIPQENTATSFAPDGDFTAEGELLQVESRGDNTYRIKQSQIDRASYEANRRVRRLWKITAEREWRTEDAELKFSIPSIIRGEGSENANHGSGTLLVTSQEQILVHWQETSSQGLLADSFDQELLKYVPSESTRKPLAFRFQNSGERPTWSGNVELLPQTFSLQESVRLGVTEGKVAVQHEFDLRIANIALDRPRIALPVLIQGEGTTPRAGGFTDLDNESVAFYVDEMLTSASLVDTLSAESMSERLDDPDLLEMPEVRWDIYELSSAIGLEREVRMQIAYDAVRLASSSPLKDVSDLRIPLARLVEPKELARHERVVSAESASDTFSVDVGAGKSPAWRLLTTDSVSTSADLASVNIRLAPNEARTQSELLVSNTWLQSIVSQEGRQDRFVALLRTSNSEVRIRLNEKVNLRPNAWRVAIDGKEVRDAYIPADDIFVIPVVDSTLDEQHSIELIYTVNDNLENWSISGVDVIVPEVLGSEVNGRFFWQIATPRTQHLVWFPSSLLAEWDWSWNGLWWGRENSRDEQSLLAFMTLDELRLPASSNQYLLSGELPSKELKIWILPRFLLWFPVGLCAIVLATGVLNFESIRHPAFFMGLAFFIGAVAMMFPDLGFLFGQTAIVSLGLVALVFVTHAAIESRMRRRSVFSSRPSPDGSDHLSYGRSNTQLSDYSVESEATAVGESP
ncbi:MAG: hypothetical protein AAF483_09540 [Planctomycetota bacterium]